MLAGPIFGIVHYCYYGSIFGIKALKGSIYFNSTFSAIADLIGYILIGCTLNNFKRRTVFFWCFIITVLAAISFYFVKVPEECEQNDK